MMNTKQKIRVVFDFLRHRRTIMLLLALLLVELGIGWFIFFGSPSRQNPNSSPQEVTVVNNTNSDNPKPNSSNEATKQPVPVKIESPASPTPNSLLNLTNWKLTLPISTNNPGSPDEIKWPELENFTIPPYFQLNKQENGVVFQAPVSGVTTANSNFPRSELREMTDGGTAGASWSSTSGTHTMLVREAITHLPIAKPEVVAGQIHDDSSYVIMVRLEQQNLFIEANNGNIGTLDTGYVLGTPFNIKIVASDGHIKVFYNEVQKLDYNNSGSGYYFKAGCYTQSNTSKGESADAYGEVVIYELKVTHS